MTYQLKNKSRMSKGFNDLWKLKSVFFLIKDYYNISMYDPTPVNKDGCKCFNKFSMI